MPGFHLSIIIKKSILFLYHFFLSVFTPLLLTPQKRDIEPEKIRNILILGQMGIGNMILFVPVLFAYKNHFENAKISLLVNNSGAEQVIEGSSLVDEIIKCNIEDLNFFQKGLFFFRIRKNKYDLILSNFNGARHLLAMLVFFSNAPFRIGHVSNRDWKNNYDCISNFKIKLGDAQPEIESNIKLAEAIGAEIVIDKPYFFLEDNHRKYASNYLQSFNITEKKILIGVQIGTSPEMSWKQWDMEKYAELTSKLMGDFGFTVIAVGSPKEKELIKSTFQQLQVKPIITAGDLTLKQTAAVIEKLNLLVCNDSGLMHVAVAVDTPMVAIYGPTDFRRTAPLGIQHTIIRKNVHCSPCFIMGDYEAVKSCQNRICLNSITVEEVLAAIEKKLAFAGTTVK